MKKQLLLPIVTLLLVFPSLRVSADPPVTFDILTTFDYPGTTFTQMQGINNNGDVAGFFLDANLLYHGFVRFTNHVTGPINEPNDAGGTTGLGDINDFGTVCGQYQGADAHVHGFLASSSVFTEMPDIGATGTFPSGVNNAGNTCGYITGAAFVIIDGTVNSFNVPGAAWSQAIDINNLNQAVGFYSDGQRLSGFRRDGDGTITYPIAARGVSATYLNGINDKGLMVGFVYDNIGRQHAILITPSGTQASYDYPGVQSTYFWGINNKGLISGNYVDFSNGYHGFIARVRPVAGE